MSHKSSKDANHDAVVEALLAAGFKVEDMHRAGDSFPDLMVGAMGQFCLLEIKDGSATDKRQKQLRKGQTEFFRRWAGYPVRLVLSPEDAVATATRLLGPPPRSLPDESMADRLKRLAKPATYGGGR